MSADLAPPSTWTQGQSGLVKVSSRSDASEYRQVVNAFSFWLDDSHPVVNVERIQSMGLWRSYAVKRSSIQERYATGSSSPINNKHANVEKKWLFHGASPQTVSKIVSQGFNRSFAGINGTKYGKGVYFALVSEYSKGYCVPDSRGLIKMFLCRVAVGDYCKGKKNQLTPDAKPGSTHEVFDSTVDDISDPEIFVVYHDAQVYPEYLVTFRFTVW